MSNHYCPYCGDEYPSRRTSGFCGKEPCVEKRVQEAVWGNVTRDGDCELWNGFCRTKGGAPIVTMYIYREDGSNYRKDYRVLQYREKDPSLANGRVYENKCGKKLCVNLDHHILHIGRPPSMVTQEPRLPGQPLLDAVERQKRLFPEFIVGNLMTDRLSRIRRDGTVSVSVADAICIDLLGVHSTAVYGWDFYTAGMKEETA